MSSQQVFLPMFRWRMSTPPPTLKQLPPSVSIAASLSPVTEVGRHQSDRASAP